MNVLLKREKFQSRKMYEMEFSSEIICTGMRREKFKIREENIP